MTGTGAAGSGDRLARQVHRLHPELSYTRAKKAVESGRVTVDGEVVQDPGRLVAPGARVELDPSKRALPRPTRRTIEILDFDAHFAVAVKPAGLLTQPTAEHEQDTLVSRVSLELARRTGGRPHVQVVQRLDKEASGLVVFALSRRGLESLQAQLLDHSLARTYEVVVEGDLGTDAGTFDRALAGDGTHRRRWVARPNEAGKVAVTHWRVERRFGSATLVRVTLETGRTHQIRIHFAAAGHAVIGERVYRRRGAPAPEVTFTRLALHAVELGFRHPETGAPVRFRAPRPADLAGLVRRLGARSRPPVRR
jgi:23S rRNA pseudouridine1911/1915/1917 synthase